MTVDIFVDVVVFSVVLGVVVFATVGSGIFVVVEIFGLLVADVAMVDGLVPTEAKVLSVMLMLDDPMLPEVERGLLVTDTVAPRLEFARGLEELDGIFVRVVGLFVLVTGRFVAAIVVAGLLVP